MIFLPLCIFAAITMSSLTSRLVVHLFPLSRHLSPYHVFLLRLSSSFSTSTSSSPPAHGTTYRRQQEEESRSVRVSVWWDFENCAVPVGANVFKVAHYITSAVRSCGIKGPVQITGFGDVLHLPRVNQEALSATGINLSHVPGGGKNSADRSLLVDLMHWVTQNPPPAHLFLISGDRDFAVILHRLRMSNYNILLACREDTPNVLCSASSIMWHWNTLVMGENVAGRYFNQPPDGPFHSWYGHYKVALEDPFLLTEAPNSQRAAATSDSETVTDCKPCQPPEDVINKIQSVVNSYPGGIGICELRLELLQNKNVDFDKDFYGHKKFSSLLLSMPHICKLKRHSGVFFASPVSAQVSETVDCTDGESREHVSSVTPRNEGQSVSNATDMTQSISSSVHINTTEVVADVPCAKAPGSVRVNKKDSEKLVKGGKDTEIQDTAVNSGAKSETLPLEKLSSLKSPVSLFDEGSKEQKTGRTRVEEQKVEGTVIEDHSPIKDQSMKKSDEIIEDPAASVDKQDSAHEMGFLRRLWNKWFGKKNMEPEKTRYEVSDETVEPTSADKASSTGEKHGNFSTEFVGDPASSSSASNGSSDPKDGFKSGTGLNRMDYSKKDELFLMDSFWSEIESFLNSKNGSKVILDSVTREDIAENLRKEGPLVIQPLDECDLLKLVHVLISDKKLIEECHSQSPRFRVSQSSKNGSNEAHNPENSRRLRSIFLGLSSCQSKSDAKREVENSTLLNQIPSLREPSNTTKKKPPLLCNRSKSEVFADCEKLLNELSKESPEGVNIGYFKKSFVEKYGYKLDYKKFGFKKLASLLQTVSGMEVGSNYIIPTKQTTDVGNTTLTEILESVQDISKDTGRKEKPLLKEEDDESLWEELGPVENTNPAKRRDVSLSLKMAVDVEYEAPAIDDDDDDSEEVSSTSASAKEDVQRKSSRADDEVSSLLRILHVWGEEEKSDDETKNSQTGSGSGNAPPIRSARKQHRPLKSYSFVSNSDDEENKLISKLGCWKKAGGDSKRLQG